MERTRRYSNDEVLQACKEGYQVLSKWWREYIERLGGKEFIETVGRKNGQARRDFIPESLEDHLKPRSPFLSMAYIHTQGEINGGWTHYLTLLRSYSDPDRFTLKSDPDRSSIDFEKPRSPAPPHYPFSKIEATTGPDIGALEFLAVRHVARKTTQKLVGTHITVDSDRGVVLGVTQLLKDGALFPSPPLPPDTQEHPHQAFTFDIGIAEPAYHINYPNRWGGGKRRFNIAEWAAQRKSFIPHPGFYLPEAILKACNFEPVVGPA